MKKIIGILFLIFILPSGSLAQNLPPPLQPPSSAPHKPPPKKATPPLPPSKMPSGNPMEPPKKGCFGQVAKLDPDKMTVTDYNSGKSCEFHIGEIDVSAVGLGDSVEADVDQETKMLRSIKKAEKEEAGN